MLYPAGRVAVYSPWARTASSTFLRPQRGVAADPARSGEVSIWSAERRGLQSGWGGQPAFPGGPAAVLLISGRSWRARQHTAASPGPRRTRAPAVPHRRLGQVEAEDRVGA